MILVLTNNALGNSVSPLKPINSMNGGFHWVPSPSPLFRACLIRRIGAVILSCFLGHGLQRPSSSNNSWEVGRSFEARGLKFLRNTMKGTQFFSSMSNRWNFMWRNDGMLDRCVHPNNDVFLHHPYSYLYGANGGGLRVFRRPRHFEDNRLPRGVSRGYKRRIHVERVWAFWGISSGTFHSHLRIILHDPYLLT